MTVAATSASPIAGCKTSALPAAATISGDGVSPAASAAASGSPPGNAAATASADAGPLADRGLRQRMIARSIFGIEALDDRRSAAECPTARACGSARRGSCRRARAGR